MDLCSSVGARLGVVGIPDIEVFDPRSRARERMRSTNPDAFDAGLPDARIGAICEERRIPFLPLSRVLSVHDHLANDTHWTPRGNARVARALARLYRESLQPGAEPKASAPATTIASENAPRRLARVRHG
jgi:hypothetical protein